ncbi:acyl-CoA thioester hydrolase/BAAT C-terminal domain-containing protein [uncultured Pseudoteredinibacter sp.]|uniref:acyl-CoA thioester hydrolase/BAAT C-terminal domain-containing protein n=1 Tax=uncultured Pseudoteredinibacter sp. TaxID=1641701 RepID=UPI0026057B58|nr:acyl-CoA thioester hydrolase/BAAT C-terminal domain-containing protein [uncultured Pseudoteredinibacter sp.]
MYKTIITLLTSLSVKALAAPLPTAIQEQNFVANYYPGNQNKTPVLVLEGSGSGIPKVLAEKISQLGHPVLALAYYKEAKLPKHLEAIPLEYFEPAKTWLLEKSHSKELAVVGWSKGAEAALLLSTLDERIRKVVAIAPSHVVWPGIVPGKSFPNSSWTMGDQPLPYVPYKANGNIRSLVDLYSNSLTDTAAVEKAEIDLEQSQADLLLFSGGKDSVWPSKTMADLICKKARQSKGEKSCVHHHYPNAGHLLDASIPLDGDPQANQEADEESRSLIQAFLR